MQNQQIYVSLVSIDKLNVLKSEIEDTLCNKITDSDFAEYVGYAYNWDVLKKFPTAKSILVAAKFNPSHKVLMHWNNKTIEVCIPPGYVQFRNKQVTLQQDISKTLAKYGFGAERIILPVKLLATRSGLAQYGRNNISYIKGIGSYHFLGSFITDIPCEDDNWQPAKVMEVCSNCQLCLKNCPTGALKEDRFLLHGELCLTYFNRNPGDFPDWIKTEWHNGLVGCFKCQEVCPVNQKFSQDIPIFAEFTQNETNELLHFSQPADLSSELISKLEKFGFPDLWSFIPRNLKVLLDQHD